MTGLWLWLDYLVLVKSGNHAGELAQALPYFSMYVIQVHLS